MFRKSLGPRSICIASHTVHTLPFISPLRLKHETDILPLRTISQNPILAKKKELLQRFDFLQIKFLSALYFIKHFISLNMLIMERLE